MTNVRKPCPANFLLSEFLETHAPNFSPPRLDREAILHGHCHQKSLMKMTAEESVLRRVGIDFPQPRPRMLRMAGSFGFEPDKYDVSIAIGELELLPAVRQAPAEWLIIAGRFQLPRADRARYAAPRSTTWPKCSKWLFMFQTWPSARSP